MPTAKLLLPTLLLTCTALGVAAHAQVTDFPYLEDFETDDGGYVAGGTNGSWEWGAPSSAFIPAAGQGANAWVTNLDGDYNSTESSYVESPVLDCTDMTGDPRLRFLHVFAMGGGDRCWVEVSLDGGPFTKLGEAGDPGSLNWYDNAPMDFWTGSSGAAGQWRTAAHDIPGGAGRLVQLRWMFTSNFTGTLDGVGLDAVAVFEPEPFLDVGAVSVDGFASGAAPTAPQQVSATITNTGNTSVSGFEVSYVVSGPVPAAATEVFPLTLAPFAPRSFTFATPVDLSVPGAYTIDVTTQLVGDQVPANDAASTSIVLQGTVTDFPYLEDFESGDGLYIHAGTPTSTWEHGEPTGIFIDDAASGSNVWTTDLDDLYAPQESSYLQSPPFDLSELVNDPFLEFSHIYNLESGDVHWVEVSIAGGPFTKLGQAGDPVSQSWYTEFGDDWWKLTSGTGEWRTARHVIEGAAGQVVVVRWVLDGLATSVFRDGIAIDDVAIFEAPFGTGQAPQTGLAVLDVNDAKEAVSFPVAEGNPGPYFTAVSATTDTFDLSFAGPPVTPFALLGGPLSVGAYVLPDGQQLDVFPFTTLASGASPGGINPFFVTDGQGDMTLSLSVPLPLVGTALTFQVLGESPPGTLFLSNAVQVSFLP